MCCAAVCLILFRNGTVILYPTGTCCFAAWQCHSAGVPLMQCATLPLCCATEPLGASVLQSHTGITQDPRTATARTAVRAALWNCAGSLCGAHWQWHCCEQLIFGTARLQQVQAACVQHNGPAVGAYSLYAARYNTAVAAGSLGACNIHGRVYRCNMGVTRQAGQAARRAMAHGDCHRVGSTAGNTCNCAGHGGGARGHEGSKHGSWAITSDATDPSLA